MRKGFCLILVLFLSAIRGYGQTNVYHPFPDSGAVWKMNLETYCNIPFPGSCHTDYQYITGGDTVFSGVNYTKVYYQTMISSCYLIPGNPFYQCTAPNYQEFYFGAYRNDTVAKKVFLYVGGGSADELLYDFSLNIGDSINSFRCAQVIVDIDSVLIGNAYRKRYVLDNNNNWVIEGIGHVGHQFGNEFAGPFDGCGEPCVCNIIWSFSCFSQDGITLYPDTSTCSIINGIEQTKRLSTINIYPNPTTSQLNISSPIIIDKIEITDVMGRVVYSEKLKVKSEELKLEREGIYFVSVMMGEQRVVRKVVVQR